TWPGAGVTVTVRLLPAPPKVMFAEVLGTRVGLAETAEIVKPAAAVSRSPIVNSKGEEGMPAKVFVAGMAETNGGVLRGRTVTKNEVLLKRPPVSVTVIVTVQTPVWAPASTLSVRLAPAPPNIILPTGIRPVFDEAALKTKLPGASSASPIVSATGV